jgi:GT2 family glycosyltransferase
VLGPRIYDSRGNVELSARGFPTVATALAGRSSYLTRVLVAAKHTPAKLLPPPGSDKSVDWVSGACMLVRRAAFERVGGFDEGYWMYWEDADLCRRLKNAGQATVYCPEAEAWHSSGASGKSMRTIDAFHLSAARYFERHVARTPAAARVARGILRVRMTVVRRRHARRP